MRAIVIEISRRHLVKFKCIVGPANLRASKGTTYIMKYRSASLTVWISPHFHDSTWRAQWIAAGRFSHDFLLGFFSLPFLASALASRLFPIYHLLQHHHHPRPHQPSENERAKNLGMPAAPADRIITGKCIQSRENSSLSISICGWRLHSKGGGGCNLLSTSLVDGQPLPSLPRKLYSSGPCFVWRRTMAAWDEIHHQETRCCCCCTSMRDRYGRFSLHRWRLTVGGNVTAKSFRRYNRAELLLPALDIVWPRLATLPIEK